VAGDIPHVAGVEHRFVDAGGLPTHVALAGKGPPVLLMHGWPQHWYMWRDVIPLVAAHARVIAPDFRGFGWSEVPRAGYEKDQLKRDVLALLDELGVGELTVAGHDWGGYVGFLLALEQPERIKSLLALSMLPPWRSRDLRIALDAWRLAYMPLLAAPGLGRHVGRSLAARGLPVRDPFLARLGDERGAATERLYRSFLTRELAPLVRGRFSASDLRVPTRLVAGSRDVVISERALRDLAAQSDLVELELLPDASHFVVDERPELVAERLLALLASEG
jgi:pimeloyl-ACP methyl ester carboxylesterase